MMPARERTDPPSEWAGATAAGDDVYWSADPDGLDGDAGPLVWHWCVDVGRWSCASAGDHRIDSLAPLTLSPSLLWPCCGKHGWIRDGQWTAA
jgi:hypothetical protein